jgi:hypothetical protein
LGPRFAGNSPEIFYKTFIMQMSRFGQIVSDILDALSPTLYTMTSVMVHAGEQEPRPGPAEKSFLGFSFALRMGEGGILPCLVTS